MSSPRILVAITSCWAHRWTHQAIRETWLDGCPLDHRFVLGHGGKAPASAAGQDELVLEAGDDYGSLTDKALAMLRWALDHGYDFLLHVGRDTYVDAKALAAAEDLRQYDYAGACQCTYKSEFCPLDAYRPGIPFHYASGGAGTWLSRRAMKMVLDDHRRHYADDLMYGWILGSNGIPLWSDFRFQKQGRHLQEGNITLHLGLGTGKYNPAWMIRCHHEGWL